MKIKRKKSKKIKCPYYKCQKGCKNNQINKHIKEFHPELVIILKKSFKFDIILCGKYTYILIFIIKNDINFEVDINSGKYKFNESAIDFVFLISEIYPF